MVYQYYLKEIQEHQKLANPQSPIPNPQSPIPNNIKIIKNIHDKINKYL